MSSLEPLVQKIDDDRYVMPIYVYRRLILGAAICGFFIGVILTVLVIWLVVL